MFLLSINTYSSINKGYFKSSIQLEQIFINYLIDSNDYNASALVSTNSSLLSNNIQPFEPTG